MNETRDRTVDCDVDAAALAADLNGAVTGSVRFDALSRTLYATDASIYEITPVGVVTPKGVADVVAVVNICRAAGASVVARGAGTGLAGGAVGAGVSLDLSRHMRRIGPLDVDARTIEVQPGVVLDELNAHVAPHGLHFAPDVATSSRATIGGMIANNSCGARSIRYGRTVDHVRTITVVLASGEVATFGPGKGEILSQNPDRGTRPGSTTDEFETRGAMQRVAAIEAGLGAIRDEHADEIAARYPKVLRSNGGYGLDRLGPRGTPIDAVKILCGSEGTLGIVVGATLQLTPLPTRTGIVVLHFENVLASLAVTPSVLEHEPSAVELIDRNIVNAGLANPTIAPRCGFLSGRPGALIIVEFFAESEQELATRMDALVADERVMSACYAHACATTPDAQRDVWNLRTSGLGLLMSKPGDRQPYAFIEDSAVDPARLRDYIERIQEILRRADVSEVAYYAHASVGCIHVRPVLNLKRADDVQRLHRIADAVSDLALEFGGAMTGEHGDGIVRSCWIEKMYGPRIVSALRDVKRLFDPEGILNPGKIVDPYPLTERLRQGASFETKPVKTFLDFSRYDDPNGSPGLHGMAGLAGMCTGVGQCRQTLVGTMCPSYMATLDERHTTRARANALRIALSNKGLLDGIDDPYLAEVMDLCLSCKACKTECPTGVDMAKLKTEYLARRNMSVGVSRRSRVIAAMPRAAAIAGRFPRIANAITRSAPFRALLHTRYGLDRRIPPPRFATQTFRAWFARHLKTKRKDRSAAARRRSTSTGPPRGAVAYFVDTWTNYFTPQVGIAAVTLLEAAGYEVQCPLVQCCGRPAISQGMLTEARDLAEANVRTLAKISREGIPIVGTEPSCLLTLVDEYPQLVRFNAARRVADNAVLLETFLARLLEEDAGALTFAPAKRGVRYHAHCHQKAIVGTSDARTLLDLAFGSLGSEIDSGCCGMAGAFGHETEHYDVARTIGEQRLFPAVRDRGDAEIAVSGFSCREQIIHHTGVTPRHLAEVLADALGGP